MVDEAGHEQSLAMNKDVALTLHATAPVLFRPLVEGEAVPARGASLAQNLRVFQACEVFEDRPLGDRSDLDPAIVLELRRLDLKMTLLLELTVEMMRSSGAGEGPSSAKIELDFSGLQWTPAPHVTGVGQKGWVEVYIHPSVPRPLRFFGVVSQFDPATRTAQMKFATLEEIESDQLERLIFRQHRRKIADARGLKRSV